jgi:hypothetical protein
VVLSLSLHAVWPASDYNSRLELFNPTIDPLEAQQSTAIAEPNRLILNYTRFAGSRLQSSSPRPQFNKGQIVHAAIPIYQKSLVAAAVSQIVEDAQESSLYSHRTIPRASGRAPPA